MADVTITIPDGKVPFIHFVEEEFAPLAIEALSSRVPIQWQKNEDYDPSDSTSEEYVLVNGEKVPELTPEERATQEISRFVGSSCTKYQKKENLKADEAEGKIKKVKVTRD